MKQVILIAVLAGAVSGVGGAVITSVLTMPVEPDSKGSVALADDGLKTVRSEIGELRRENERLLDRLRALEERPAALGSGRLPAGEPESLSYEQLEREVASLRAALVDPGPGQVPPAIRSTVKAAIADLKQEELRQEELEREARRIERIDQRMSELSTTLGLDAQQSRRMRDVLIDESRRREEMMRGMRDQPDWAVARDQVQALRQDVERSLTQILTPAQFQQYQESGAMNFGFGQRGRGEFRVEGDASGQNQGERGQRRRVEQQRGAN